MNGKTGNAPPRELPRAVRTVLGLAVLCAALAAYRTYHAKNWRLAGDSVVRVLRDMRPFRNLPAPAGNPGGRKP